MILLCSLILSPKPHSNFPLHGFTSMYQFEHSLTGLWVLPVKRYKPNLWTKWMAGTTRTVVPNPEILNLTDKNASIMWVKFENLDSEIQTLTISYIDLTAYREAFFVAIFQVLAMKFLDQIWFQSDFKILNFHFITFLRQNLLIKTLKWPEKD